MKNKIEYEEGCDYTPLLDLIRTKLMSAKFNAVGILVNKSKKQKLKYESKKHNVLGIVTQVNDIFYIWGCEVEFSGIIPKNEIVLF